MIYRRHRHHRRHRHAAQSVPAFGPGAEPQVRRRTSRRSAAPSASTPSTRPSALTIAFFVNAAILVLAAMVFFGKTSVTVAGGQVVDVQPRQRLDSHRLPDARAAARHDRGQHALRRGPAGQRPKQHHHRHARRTGRHGRLHALADPALGAAADHPQRWPSCRRSSSSACAATAA